MTVRMELLSSLQSLTGRGMGYEEEKTASGGKGYVQGRRAVDREAVQERCTLKAMVAGCKREFGLMETVKEKERYGNGE